MGLYDGRDPTAASECHTVELLPLHGAISYVQWAIWWMREHWYYYSDDESDDTDIGIIIGILL